MFLWALALICRKLAQPLREMAAII
jgi:hypothetical protein